MVIAVTRSPSRICSGPIPFNIYLNDLFYLTEMTQVSYFADDTTFYSRVPNNRRGWNDRGVGHCNNY